MTTLYFGNRKFKVRKLDADLPYKLRVHAEIVQRYGQDKIVEVLRKLKGVEDDVFATPGQMTVVPLYKMGDGRVLCIVPMKSGGENWMTVLYAEDVGYEVPEEIEVERIYEAKPGHQRTPSAQTGDKP
jgi:hypothetical protein